MIPGSCHGVIGNDACVPDTGNACAVQPAGEDFDLGAVENANAFKAGHGTWVFKPTNPVALVMSAPDDTCARYYWPIHIIRDGGIVAPTHSRSLGAPS